MMRKSAFRVYALMLALLMVPIVVICLMGACVVGAQKEVRRNLMPDLRDIAECLIHNIRTGTQAR